MIEEIKVNVSGTGHDSTSLTKVIEPKVDSLNCKVRYDFDSYEQRPSRYAQVSRNAWNDWTWQQQNALRTLDQLELAFPDLPSDDRRMAEAWQKRSFRFQITPYVESLVEKDATGKPRLDDPLWKQFFPAFPELIQIQTGLSRPDEYSPKEENWEYKNEFLTPIAQLKYLDRVLIDTLDACLMYCTYCFRSLQSNAPEEKKGSLKEHWESTLDAIRSRPQIREVIFSGGDPLLLNNGQIEKLLQDVRSIPTVELLRIHTRVLSHNPARLDANFAKLLKKYEVTGLGVHVTHPHEITHDFKEAVDRIHETGASTFLFNQSPFLKGINDNLDVLINLYMGVFRAGIKPYSLIHDMPNTPATASLRPSVRKGRKLMNELLIRFSGQLTPRYAINHHTGKKLVPEQLEGTPDFRYVPAEENEFHHPVIVFTNWKGEPNQIYLDGID